MPVNDYIKVFYEFEENGLLINHTNKVKVIAVPKLDIGFESAVCSLNYQLVGRTHNSTTKVVTITIDTHNSWKKDTEYEYDITLDLGDLPTSFRGNNLDIIWRFFFEVELDKKSISLIRNKLLKDTSFGSLLRSFDGKHQNKNLVLVQNPKFEYQTLYFNLTYKISVYMFLTAGVFLSLLSVILYIAEAIKKFIWVPILLGLGLSGYGIYKKIGIGTLKKVHFKGSHADKENFDLEIAIERNYKNVSSASIYYHIKEEIIDNRGTTDTTLTEIVFISPQKTINELHSNTFNLQLPYPDKDIPLDFYRSNIRFFAEIVVEFEFKNKTKGKLRQEFPLKKVN